MVKKWEVSTEREFPSPIKDTVQEEEQSAKVTILLPKDTLDTIDQMVKNAKVGSRGRLIQLLVDDIWDLQGEYRLIAETTKATTKGTMDTNQFVIGITMGLTGVMRRLARYYDPSTTNLFQATSPDDAQRRGVGTPSG